MKGFGLSRRTMFAATASLALPGAARAGTAHARLLPGKPELALGAFHPEAAGYDMAEYIISGTATSYRQAGSHTHGPWDVAPARTARYATRIVVIRPKDAGHFNGTVVAEWLNVSTGRDMAPVWSMTRRELLRSGFAYAAISAQRVGVAGGKALMGGTGKGLKQTDPQRYASLMHPGDAYSYDIFSQAAALLKPGNPGGVLGGLQPRQVIGAGESQSAIFLTTYVNAIDPLARVCDGFLIYSRFGNGAPLDGGSIFGPGALRIVKLREDLRVPALILETETDLLGPIGFYRARQPDTDRLRTWEVAGSAHVGAYLLRVTDIDSGTASIAALAAAYAPNTHILGATLAKSYNNGPQTHYAAEAAIAHLARWAAQGKPPPHAAPLEMVDANLPFYPCFPRLDGNGNILGGIRSPWMDVPTSTLTGYGNSGAPDAFLFGSAEPFSAARLTQLYPGGKPDYMRRFTAALDRTIAAGFILPTDRTEILGLAAYAYGGRHRHT